MQSSHSLFYQAPVRDQLLEHLERIVGVVLGLGLLAEAAPDAGGPRDPAVRVHAGAGVAPAMVPLFEA